MTVSLAYALCVLYITILPRTPALAQNVRPIPFWSFLDWYKGNWSRGGSIALNIVLFIPLGYLLSGVWKSKKASLITCLAMTIAIEVAQYFSYYGYFDTDDIIANFLGGVIGVLCFQRFGERLKRFHVPALLLLVGLIGCIITTGNTVVYETQFDFRIQSVKTQNNTITLSGNCDVYRRGFLPYQIQLKGETLHTSTRWAAGNTTAWMLWLRCRERILLLAPYAYIGGNPVNAGAARLCGVSPHPVPDTATALPNHAFPVFCAYCPRTDRKFLPY